VYVVPVLCMTSYVPMMGPVAAGRSRNIFTDLWRSVVHANAPAPWFCTDAKCMISSAKFLKKLI